MRIPVIFLKDKQAFSSVGGRMRLLGKPIDVARGLKEEGFVLIHITDMDALKGQPTNLDVYDALTFFINVQVECAPRDEIVKKLLSLKCRVVLPPDSPLGVSGYREKKLLVARIPKGYGGDAEGFHDVILDEADPASVKRFESLGKRIIINENDSEKVKNAWGTLISS
ncbi:MAG: hypothetical protein AB1324_01955 [Candidatus Micrarchaeota archaeon]